MLHPFYFYGYLGLRDAWGAPLTTALIIWPGRARNIVQTD